MMTFTTFLQSFYCGIAYSFVFNEKREMISGDDAFNLVKKSIQTLAISEYSREMMFAEILQKAECHKC